MQARALATSYPTVKADTDALTAARLLTEHNRPGLIVVDDHDHPIAVLPGSQVLRAVIPGYVRDDPTLARVLEEDAADRICEKLREHTVKELLPDDRPPLVVVEPDETVLEIAAKMAAARSPLVAVLDSRGKQAALLGAITVYDLLARILPPADA